MPTNDNKLSTRNCIMQLDFYIVDYQHYAFASGSRVLTQNDDFSSINSEYYMQINVKKHNGDSFTIKVESTLTLQEIQKKLFFEHDIDFND